ncbi:MAG: hypothetical protein P8Q97_17465 [Myxococcota bacterium]|jgi:hypothetical protein|nr:hypothetical protein [Myxococcota bacterium]
MAIGERSTRGGWRAALLVLVLVACGSASPASAEDYEPSQAGNPLRIVAYVIYPVGVVFDYLILRPAYWVGSQEPFKTVFGRTD